MRINNQILENIHNNNKQLIDDQFGEIERELFKLKELVSNEELLKFIQNTVLELNNFRMDYWNNRITESEDYEDYTDKEIIKDIIDNFKKITGKEIKDVLNYDKNEEGFFKQNVVEKTSESIINYLTKKGLSRSHIDDLLYLLDDELTSLWNK